MKDATKILLDRLESIAKKLDKYFLALTLFLLFGFTTLLQADEIIAIPLLGTKISDPGVFHTIIAASLTALFGMIGSGLLDYFTKRKLYDEQLSSGLNEDEKALRVSLITRSQYENIYKSKDKPETIAEQKGISWKKVFWSMTTPTCPSPLKKTSVPNLYLSSP